MIGSRTYVAKRENVERKWYVVDAEDAPLGRLAVFVAHILAGKHKPTYTPHVDCGDFVIVINADKVKLTGKKAERSVIYSHSGYKGSLKATSLGTMLSKRPERLVERAVRGMLPHNRLRYDRKLKVYCGPEHPHAAQKPEPLRLEA